MKMIYYYYHYYYSFKLTNTAIHIAVFVHFESFLTVKAFGNQLKTSDRQHRGQIHQKIYSQWLSYVFLFGGMGLYILTLTHNHTHHCFWFSSIKNHPPKSVSFQRAAVVWFVTFLLPAQQKTSKDDDPLDTTTGMYEVSNIKWSQLSFSVHCIEKNPFPFKHT